MPAYQLHRESGGPCSLDPGIGGASSGRQRSPVAFSCLDSIVATTDPVAVGQA